MYRIKPTITLGLFFNKCTLCGPVFLLLTLLLTAALQVGGGRREAETGGSL
jgi:hypothetical protein